MSALETFYYFYNQNDPRTSEWFLVSRPKTLLAIVLFYTWFCVSLGPRYMKNKKPYSLRTTLVVYNFIQVLLSSYLVYEGLRVWLFVYSWTCQPVDYSDNPLAIRVAHGSHLYFVCKLIELLDTVFFVFRKKQRQISFLHLYHHASMPLLAWYGVRYVPSGHPTLLGTINSFIHIIMYAYYMLAALGPEVQKYLWWKKYLTILQMLQFTIIATHSGQMLFNDCNFPKLVSLLIVVESVIFLWMFGSFYVKAQGKNNVCAVKSDNASSNYRTILKSN